MNTPIISPIWFYMMDVSDKLILTTGIVFFLCIIVVIVFFITLPIIQDELPDDDFKKMFKYLMISLSVSGFLFMVVPSQDTMMKMLIAQNITYERVEGGKEMVKDTVDYIFEKIDESKEGEK